MIGCCGKRNKALYLRYHLTYIVTLQIFEVGHLKLSCNSQFIGLYVSWYAYLNLVNTLFKRPSDNPDGGAHRGGMFAWIRCLYIHASGAHAALVRVREGDRKRSSEAGSVWRLNRDPRFFPIVVIRADQASISPSPFRP